MIPTCLTLNANQLRILSEFECGLPKRDEEDMDCCMTSRLTFEVTTSGIGDCVWVRCGEKRAWLDDGLEP